MELYAYKLQLHGKIGYGELKELQVEVVLANVAIETGQIGIESLGTVIEVRLPNKP